MRARDIPELSYSKGPEFGAFICWGSERALSVIRLVKALVPSASRSV